jgi:hypothetical protein
MFGRKLASVVLTFAFTGLACYALGQDASDDGRYGAGSQPKRPGGLLGELDQLGRSLFGDSRSDRDKPTPSQPAKTGTKKATGESTVTSKFRAGGADSPPPATISNDTYRGTVDDPDSRPSPASKQPTTESGKPLRRLSDDGAASRSRGSAIYADVAQPADDDGGKSSASKTNSGATPPTMRPLHERLSSMRRSAFDAEPSASTSDRPVTNGASDPPATGRKPLPAAAVVSQPDGETVRSPGVAPAAPPATVPKAWPTRPAVAPASSGEPRPATRPEVISKPAEARVKAEAPVKTEAPVKAYEPVARPTEPVAGPS